MKTVLVILLCAAICIALVIFFFRTTKLKRAFALEAQKLSDKELDDAVLDLWEQTGERFCLKISYKLDVFEKECERRR